MRATGAAVPSGGMQADLLRDDGGNDAVTGAAEPSRDPLSRRIIGAAIEVHRTLGPGLLESIYLECLCRELTARGIPYEVQVPVQVLYKSQPVACAFRLDLLVDRQVVVEVKSVERFAAVHQAQVLTYLRLVRVRVGLLINFNTPRLVDGVKRLRL